MQYADCIILVTAVIERAVKDADSKEVCPHATGHPVGRCSKPLVDSLRAYAKREGNVTGHDIATEFMRLVFSG